MANGSIRNRPAGNPSLKALKGFEKRVYSSAWISASGNRQCDPTEKHLILEEAELGLMAKRIHQDLKSDHGFATVAPVIAAEGKNRRPWMP